MTRRTLPVAVYRNGIRYVVGEAGVEVDDDEIDLNNVEINITNPVLSKIISPVREGDFSIGRASGEDGKAH